MLPHFPTPYPEETLFSLAARYWELNGGPETHLREDLPFLRKSQHYPSRLLEFQKNLPPTHTLREEDLVLKRTLFPIFAFGQNPEKAKALRREIELDGHPNHKSNRGLKSKMGWLKHCPVCLQAQQKTHGETFWLRVHQVPTVLACPHHGVYLHRWKDQAGRPYTPPTEETQTGKALAWEVDHAKNCLGILQGFTIQQRKLSRYLWHHLLKQKFGKRLGAGHCIHSPEIVEKAREQFSSEFLEEAGIDFDENFGNLIRSAADNRRHSFQRILFILCVTEMTLEDFDRPINKPREDFPCRNPLAPCFLKETIHGVRQMNKIRWAFKCPDCGFEYTLPAKQLYRNHRDDRPRVRILETGHQWDEVFANLWNDRTKTNRWILNHLSIPYSKLLSEGERLGLTGRSVTKAKRAMERNREARKEKTILHKKEWLDGLPRNKNLGRTHLFQKYAKAARWLRKHEPVWLQTHQPPKIKMTPEARQGGTKTLEILKRLDQETPPATGFNPRRSLDRLLEVASPQEKEWIHLYRTNSRIRKFITTHTESLSAYWWRKVEHTATLFQLEGRRPTVDEFCERAAIHKFRVPELKKIINQIQTKA